MNRAVEIDLSALPQRAGGRPRTTSTNPHTQLDQTTTPLLVDELARRALALPGVEDRPSLISVPGARALWLAEDQQASGPHAFIIGREFAHIHPPPDGSLHMVLPREVAHEAVAQGWAEPHPAARVGYIPETVVMVYAPRDEAELEVVLALLGRSLEQAQGV
ncbi:MAG: luciferase family protein [Longimicrobiales bacterium]